MALEFFAPRLRAKAALALSLPRDFKISPPERRAFLWGLRLHRTRLSASQSRRACRSPALVLEPLTPAVAPIWGPSGAIAAMLGCRRRPSSPVSYQVFREPSFQMYRVGKPRMMRNVAITLHFTTTFDPSGTRPARSMTSWFNIRMQPEETALPILPGSVVP